MNEKLINIIIQILGKYLNLWFIDIQYKFINNNNINQYCHLSEGHEERSVHCVKLCEMLIVFYSKNRDIDGLDRCILDWLCGLSFTLTEKNLDSEELRLLIDELLPKKLISLFMIFDNYDLSNPWKQISNKIRYFGITQEHYDYNNYNLFNQEELIFCNNYRNIIYEAEKLNDMTNEGNKFEFNCAIIKGMQSNNSISFSEAIQKTYMKCLASKKNVYLIDNQGNFFDIFDISTEVISSINLKEIFPNEEFLCEEGSDFIINKIFNYNIDNPNRTISIISANKYSDIFIYKNQTISFFKRNSKWLRVDLKGLVYILKHFFKRDSIDYSDCSKLAVTIYDMIIHKKGCCLGIIDLFSDNKNVNQFLEDVKIGEIDEKMSMTRGIARCFCANTRSVRKSLLSIDGAVLLEAKTGAILNVGSIIENTGASSQGARTTAAKSIACKGGFAIKVSDDGYCEIYTPQQKEVNIDLISPAFTIAK